MFHRPVLSHFGGILGETFETITEIDILIFSMDKSEFQNSAAVKRYAFFGITTATVATLTAIVAVPMLCLFLQGIQSSLQDEVCPLPYPNNPAI